jgi:uncharacterized protein YukE
MDISIVIPAYHAADTVGETLESVLAQSFPNWEAIVVDDGSRDRTGDVVNRFAKRDGRIRLIRQRNRGEGGARNAGIAQARFDWLLFLDADDWLLPHYLERMSGALKADRSLDAVHCGSVYVAPDGRLSFEKYCAQAGDLFDVFARYCAFAVHACVVRRSLVEAVGLFEPSLQACADWDLWQRVARTGARFGKVPEVLALCRMRPGSASSKGEAIFTHGLEVIRRGYAPDPRVPHPKPAHADGRPRERLDSAVLDFACGAAALMIGSHQDPRPVLEGVRGFRDPDLDPRSVAYSLLEKALFPRCRTPFSWIDHWSDLEKGIEDFLAALEAQAQAQYLAGRTLTILKRLIIDHAMVAPSLPIKDRLIMQLRKGRVTITRRRAVSAERLRRLKEFQDQYIGELERRTVNAETLRDESQRFAEETERTKRLLEEELAAWRRRTEEWEQRGEEQRIRLVELERVRTAIEEEAAQWRWWTEEWEQRGEEQRIRLVELERVRTAIEGEAVKWRQAAEELEQLVNRQRARIDELEQTEGRLASESATRQEQVERLGRHIAKLEQSLAQAHEEISRLRNSLSWRVTAPARMAYDMLASAGGTIRLNKAS